MDIQSLKEYCEKNGYDSRKYRFRIISELLSISEDEAKSVEKITRYLREIFPVDEVGIKKEKEWHKPEYLHRAEWEYDKIKKDIINQDTLL